MARANAARRLQPDRPIPAKTWRGFALFLFGGALAFMVLAPLLHLDGWQSASALLCGMGLTSLLVHHLATKGQLRNAEPKPEPIPGSRRGLGKETEAVSPVIGVILMVAITVVLAAVVFFLVTKLSHSPESAPTLSFQTTSSTTSSFSTRLISQSDPVQWDTCAVKSQTGATLPFTVNGAALVAGAKSGAGDVLQISGLATKTHYDALLICAGATVGSFQGDTL